MNNSLLTNKKGSSETIREAFNFNFYNYIQNKPEHIKMVDQRFLEWFIGFTEGDGSFIIYLKKTKTRKKMCFTINQDDSQLLFKIKKQLGFGQVTTYKQNNKLYYRYSVSDIKNITRLIHLFNGNLILEKVQNRFSKWLTCYNNLYPNNYIEPKLFSPILSLNSAWLSGFIDAEGCFYASLTEQNNLKLKYRLRLKFYITQKNEYELLKAIMKMFYFKYEEYLISKPLLSKVKTKKKLTLYNLDRYISRYSNIDRLEISTNILMLVIIDYLTDYKLQGKKRISFLRWKRIYLNKDILKNVSIKSKKSLKRFKKLVIAVNKKKKS